MERERDGEREDLECILAAARGVREGLGVSE